MPALPALSTSPHPHPRCRAPDGASRTRLVRAVRGSGGATGASAAAAAPGLPPGRAAPRGRTRTAGPCPFPESPAALPQGRKRAAPSPTHAQQHRAEEPQQSELLHGATPHHRGRPPYNAPARSRPGRGRWAARHRPRGFPARGRAWMGESGAGRGGQRAHGGRSPAATPAGTPGPPRGSRQSRWGWGVLRGGCV